MIKKTILCTFAASLLMSSALFAFGPTVNGVRLNEEVLQEETSGISYRTNRFGDIYIDQENLPNFAVKGKESIEQIKGFIEKLSSKNPQTPIFMELPLEHFGLAQYFITAGFDRRYVDNNWLELVVKNGSSLPDLFNSIMGSRTMLVVGNEVLLIEDTNQKGIGLFPGGENDINQLLHNTAVREVGEEVGVKLDPKGVHLLGRLSRTGVNRVKANGTTDYYFTRLHEKPKVTIQESEISDYGWFNISTLLQDREAKREGKKPLELSEVVLKLLEHVNSGATTSKATEFVLDFRQIPRAEKDHKDVMQFNIFALPPMEPIQLPQIDFESSGIIY